jgi:hypothetical protein
MKTSAQRLARYSLIVLVVSAFGYGTIRRHCDTRADGTLEVHSDVLTFVKAGEDLLQGRNIYYGADGGKNSYVYPPVYALLNVPLVPLPPLAVDIGWYLLNALLLFGVFVHAYSLFTGGDFRSLPARAQWILVASSVALALRYIVRNAQDANINVLLLFLIVAAVARMHRTGNPWWAALIGIAGAVKLLPMIFVVYFLARRQWKAVAVMIAAFGAATFLPALFIGIPKTVEYLREFFAYGSTQLTPTGLEVENFSVWGTLGRLLSASKAFEYPDGVPVFVNIAEFPLPWLKAAVALVDVGFVAILAMAARADGSEHRRSLVLAILVMNLVSVLTEDHHTVGFALAYFYLLLRWREGALARGVQWLVVVSGAASTLISYDLVVPLLGKLAYMRMLAYGLPVLPVGLVLSWLVWRNVPRASGTS